MTNSNWTCNKKVDNQLRVLPVICGYTFRFQIPCKLFSIPQSL